MHWIRGLLKGAYNTSSFSQSCSALGFLGHSSVPLTPHMVGFIISRLQYMFSAADKPIITQHCETDDVASYFICIFTVFSLSYPRSIKENWLSVSWPIRENASPLTSCFVKRLCSGGSVVLCFILGQDPERVFDSDTMLAMNNHPAVTHLVGLATVIASGNY